MWKFCGNAQFRQSFGRITRHSTETVRFHKWNYGTLCIVYWNLSKVPVLFESYWTATLQKKCNRTNVSLGLSSFVRKACSQISLGKGFWNFSIPYRKTKHNLSSRSTIVRIFFSMKFLITQSLLTIKSIHMKTGWIW